MKKLNLTLRSYVSVYSVKRFFNKGVIYLMVASLALLPAYPLSPLAMAWPDVQGQYSDASGAGPEAVNRLQNEAGELSEVNTRPSQTIVDKGRTLQTLPMVDAVFLPNFAEVEQFVEHLEQRIRDLQAENVPGRRIELEFQHFGNASSMPEQLHWLMNHLGHLAARSHNSFTVKLDIVEPADMERRGEKVREVLDNWSDEFAHQGTAIVRYAEEMSDQLKKMEDRAGQVRAQLDVFEANLVSSGVSESLEIVKYAVADLMSLLDDARERSLGPRSSEYSFTEHGAWYRKAAHDIESLHGELLKARQRGQLSQGDNLIDERVLYGVKDISLQFKRVATLLDEMANVYQMEYTSGRGTYLRGQEMTESERAFAADVVKRIKDSFSLTYRRAMGLPRHMTFAMYREIFTPNTHFQALREAAGTVREVVRANGLSWKNLRSAYPQMSKETQDMLRLYSSSVFRAALGFSVTYAVMSMGVAQHPGQVLSAELGASVASFWLFFTGVIGLANLDFFAQGTNFDASRSYDSKTGKYDFFRGFKSNKPFALAGTFVHSALIAFMVQQAYNLSWTLPEGVFATTMSAVVLSVAAKFVPTLFLAKHHEKKAQVSDGGSHNHSNKKTTWFNLAFDIFLQTVKSMKLFAVKVGEYDAAKVILWTMAMGGAIAVAREKYRDWQAKRWGNISQVTFREFFATIKGEGLKGAFTSARETYRLRRELQPRKYEAEQQTTLMTIKLRHNTCAIVF